MVSKSLAPSDIVAVLFFLSGKKTFINYPPLLHHTLLVAREFSLLLRQFGFSRYGVHPMSRTFDEALGIIKQSRILRVSSPPECTRLVMDREASDYVEQRIIPRFSLKELRDLEAACVIIGEACGVERVPSAEVGEKN